MKKLTIVWKHLDVKGETCVRCSDTGEAAAAVVDRLNDEYKARGIIIDFIREPLDGTAVTESNSLLFNGIPIEQIIGMDIRQNYCASCSDLLGKETCCRTVVYEGAEYEDIPSEAIRKAAELVLELKPGQGEAKQKPSGCSCGCKSGCC